MSKSYFGELKTQRKAAVSEMSRIMGDGQRTLTPNERNRFDNLRLDIEGIDTRISQVKNENAYSLRGKRGSRSEEDIAFTRFLRTGNASGLRETRADGTGFSTAP